MDTRGPTRLSSITYPMLSDWTCLAVGTVRNLASRDAFDRRSVADTMRWVNGRRDMMQLPRIGMPAMQADSVVAVAPEEPIQSPLVPSDSSYDPYTGTYEG